MITARFIDGPWDGHTVQLPDATRQFEVPMMERGSRVEVQGAEVTVVFPRARYRLFRVPNLVRGGDYFLYVLEQVT